MKKRIVSSAFAAIILLTCLIPSVAQSGASRPANFVFLIDVSGSMVLKKTMVTGAGGQQITLFEALRQALQQIVADERLLTPQSKVAFVTFGTAVTDKGDWPTTLDKPDNRQTLTQNISSPEQLQADKHGDTYMAGALDRAFEKATQLSGQSEPCTTTFIIMLTDGWDEPPQGAPLKVRDIAAKIVQKQSDLRKKLGVNTWQTRVVGLQRLPDSKAGTTTAAQVAKLVGGEFLDVTKQSSGTVAQRIYAALEKTVHDLEGKVEVAKAADGGFADFGSMQGGTDTTASIPVVSRSCYGEKITSVQDVSGQLTAAQRDVVQRQFDSLKSSGKLKDKDSFAAVTAASKLPARALDVVLEQELPLAPTIDQMAQGGTVWQPMKIRAKVGRTCPPGSYLGAIKLNSTAYCDAIVPYIIAVPSRIVSDSESISGAVHKPGFLFTKPTSTNLEFAIGTSLAGQDLSPEEVVIEPDSAHGPGNETFDKSLINGGRPATIKLNMTEKASQKVVLPVEIPANQRPGKYTGVLHVKIPGSTKVMAPAAISYTLDVFPSPWEQVSPIAVPIIILLAVVIVLWLGIWIATKR